MGVINRIHRLGAWILGSFFLREFIPKIRAYILQSRQRNIAQTCRIYARLHTASRCESRFERADNSLEMNEPHRCFSCTVGPSTSNNRRKSLISERDAENKHYREDFRRTRERDAIENLSRAPHKIRNLNHRREKRIDFSYKLLFTQE